jgi:Sigma-54 interaction domain/FHA domain
MVPKDGTTWGTITSASDVEPRARDATPPVPGLVLIFTHQGPAARIFQFEGTPITLGRLELAEGDSFDTTVSREHVRFTYDGTGWLVTDLGSRNGTFVEGRAISGETRVPHGCLVRIGAALVLGAEDVVPFKDRGLGIRDGVVGGPALRAALNSVALVRSVGMTPALLITGESGTGKEIAAQTFHGVGPRPNSPFVAVNCATIPKDLAERLLFGSRRGSYSGATDAEGYVQAAHGGTLFLDEIAELPGDVQSKLLRMLETRKVLRLGATTYEQVEVRVCAATWRDLRKEVGGGRFRQDLYFRIAQAEVRLPPLRDRLVEVPWHIQQVLDECGPDRRLSATTQFVEECCGRHWPGNVRELRAAVRRAAAETVAQGSYLLAADRLGPTAGEPIPRSLPAPSSLRVPDDEFAAALAHAEGNVVRAARGLGVHRNKVRRWLERHQVDAARFKASSKRRS